MTIRDTIRLLARSNFALVMTLLFVSGTILSQQLPSAPSSTSSPLGSSTTDAETNGSTTSDAADSRLSSSGSSSNEFSAANSLSAMQINSILQQRPELIIELKSLLADQLQQQGVKIQADSITDEMLFSQIASNADLRANITVWLRSRGYISAADIRRSGTDISPGNDDQFSLSGTTLDTLSQLPRSELSSGLPPSPSDQLDAGLNGPSISSSSTGNQTAGQVPRNIPENQHNVTDDPHVLRVPAPYNLRSLRDLYTQIPQDSNKLKRFGSEVFLNHDTPSSTATGLGTHNMPIDLPVGPDYVLGTGDGLTINIWGGVSQSVTRVIDREGKIVLPEAGSLVIAGLTLQHAQSTIEDALKQQFRNARVDITIARLRSVRVYVVGDVQRPGAYDISSLSTPLNALYAAGGPTSVGSLRIVQHYRGKMLLREVDLYDFLLHGMRMDDERLEAGDTLLVPPAGQQVAIFGMVKRPAIYELKGNSSLAEMLEDAGGVTVAAALDHITIERIQPNQQRETVSLPLSSSATPKSALDVIASFMVKDGDRIHVAPILPYSERAIYVEGHVVRPGKFPYRDGMQLSDVVRTYQDMLPEPAARGDIVRLVPPDLHPETIEFDVADVLIGNTKLSLQPFDTVRIFGRYQVDSPAVVIRGEVLRPGSYALSQGMTTSQLIKMAGGFKRDALLDSADLTSYTVQDGKKIVGQRTAVNISTAIKAGDIPTDVPLKAGDVLTIHQISGWNDIGASVVLKGEVTYPGSYGLQEGEHLSSVLRRAGGLRDTAYASGAVLVRTQVKELEEKSRVELIRQIETTSASARLGANLTTQDQTATLQAAAQQQNQVLERLRSQPSTGRLVIRISADINSWAGTPADVEMRSGDVLTIPKRPGFVLVTGQVYNSSAITFVPGKEAGWYLRRAGGTNEVANRKEIFVIRANGSVVGRHSGEWYSGNVLSTRLDPGDVIVVPQKIIGSLFWRNLLTVAQLSSSIAITAAVAGLL
jgi:protein involved in polysaccharide export with SLBB domain